ncbi:MAG: 50S ribosomal protein L1 [Candidatus Schekmanbacteria bacterium RIFCSPHIGHO2_02_FULL_38_11]|uniref:Large ribosomal subunit protein uL1 n=1 Tax=Candidatus Schekmanbacteria bacterium RIFCSPLOWO2_12_FULL_38_15 TaxID=1817883 RepID=A0A1F7SCV2_9BACT|nr:MAG: 50S ribosomal protein L1 [Candidatus Schekmanbacteria bacterium RIFCSPLOWO2_02_FULL_38_14]OGL51616.1 MAG: 50S ribosomal protein L1 [Candidatus Schekmanbacteria bacterium RIFCSPLOWO2_12_FULL_38_15]OGL55182.1 MAG: 50S ribosomal protein L1 [Candidatus Schekmanbacteria bacterium RIFCSPHIGHO2_02_FULL_38_11]
MARAGKRYKSILETVDREKIYDIEKAFELARASAKAKFDESIDIAVNLGVDPKHADQMIRGTVVLPNGIGKKVRVLAIAKGEKEREAKEAGADFIGGEDIIKKIQDGWLDFDRVVATPDMMSSVGKLGKILGPRGLMPNPKTGTISFDIGRTVKEIKSGKIEFKVEKAGIVHCSVGKASFDVAKLVENFRAFINAVIRLKPASSKGKYIKKITVSSTMGVGVKIDTGQVMNIVK